ncbi:hypothetical protein [Rhodopseudomonas palustris]|nr:hypothetical protein [Rhodopseudomonas palustris]
MVWVSWVGAAGNAIELVGFGILAWDLSHTNRSSIDDANAMIGEADAFEAVVISDGDRSDPPGTPRTEIIGGKLGRFQDGFSASLSALEVSRRRILFGVLVTAAGAALQTFSAIWQALFPS